jgi:hypothetical protein
MIGRQSAILVTNEDLEQLTSLLLKRGDVRMLSHETNESRTSLLPLKSLAGPGQASLHCYLAPAQWEPDIKLKALSDVKTSVDVEHSEIVELWRSSVTGDQIRAGRIFYTPVYAGAPDYRAVRKDERFIKWAERTVAAIRRWLVHDKTYGAYAGADAARRIASGELGVISLTGTPLHPKR